MNFQVGELSRFFHLSASTLRYWEDQGVITPQKNKNNQYRTYAVSDLMTIPDIIFYKSLGILLMGCLLLQFEEEGKSYEHIYY